MTWLIASALRTVSYRSSLRVGPGVLRISAFNFLFVWATVLLNKPLLTTSLVALAFARFEGLSRISMFSSRPPLTSARRARFLKVSASSFGRLPKLPTLEPLHLRIGMTGQETAQSRKQVFAIGSPE